MEIKKILPSLLFTLKCAKNCLIKILNFFHYSNIFSRTFNFQILLLKDLFNVQNEFSNSSYNNQPHNVDVLVTLTTVICQHIPIYISFDLTTDLSVYMMFDRIKDSFKNRLSFIKKLKRLAIQCETYRRTNVKLMNKLLKF